MKSFGVAGFLYNPKTREVLLHKRDGNTSYNPHKWASFGGLGEGEETPPQAFVREMEEELGIKLNSDALLPLCDYPSEISGHRYAFYVVSDIPKSEMTLGEGADFNWIPLDTIFDLELTPRTIQDLRALLEKI